VLAQYLLALLAVTKVNIGLEIQTFARCSFAHCFTMSCSLFKDLPNHSHCRLVLCVVLRWVMPAWQHQLARNCSYQAILGTAARQLALSWSRFRVTAHHISTHLLNPCHSLTGMVCYQGVTCPNRTAVLARFHPVALGMHGKETRVVQGIEIHLYNHLLCDAKKTVTVR
jgi:hypothetical protein